MINRCKWHLLSLALMASVAFVAPPVAAETQSPLFLRALKHKAVGKSGFNWHANANPAASDAEAIARTKAAIANARALAKGATWVCSPSGSGRKASCYQG
jgi:hypothetical protein